MKKFPALVVLAAASVFLLSACGSSKAESSAASSSNKNTASSASASAASPVKKDGKVLVAYFSWSGTSEKQAQAIADNKNADLFRIETATPYPKEYDATTKVAKKEADDNARPALKEPLPSLDSYNKVILCYPIWWHTAPMAVGTFLNAYDWSGKTIYPVVQSAALDPGHFDASIQFVKANAKNATVDKGIYTKDNQQILDYVKGI